MLPRVIIHNAVSVDGRVDGFAVDQCVYYELASRWKENATLAGCDTMLKGDVPPEDAGAFEPPPQTAGDTRPLLVVPDSRGRLRSWHALRQSPYWRGMVALCSRSTPEAYLDYLRKRHVEYIVTGDDRVDLRAALEALADRYGVRTVRVDSGGTLNGVLLRAGLVSEVSVLLHPTLVGGTLKPAMFFQSPAPTGPDATIPLKLTHVEQLKDGVVWLRYDAALPSRVA